MRRSFLVSIVMLLVARTPAWSQGRVVESEPNNTSAAANAAAIGDTLIGSISSVGDTDFFAITIAAGSYMHIAQELQLCLIDKDGIAYLRCSGGEYQKLLYPVMTTGRYYLRVRPGTPEAGHIPMGPYKIVIEAEPFSLGAGDPPRTLVRFERGYDRIAAGLHGELYVATSGAVPSDRVLRISPAGDTMILASGLYVGGNLVVDAFGDVVFGDGADLWKILPDGSLSQFTTGRIVPQFSRAALAVGPDGDIWIGTSERITRLDPTGARKGEIPLPEAHEIAVGPSGKLYVASGSEGCTVYVVVGTDIACTIPDTSDARFEPPLALAIGQDGTLYAGYPDALGEGGSGHVDVFPTGSKTWRLYAHVPGLQALTFVRDQEGNMTPRLLASAIGVPTRIVELNGANDRAVGAGFKVRFFHTALDPLPPATVAVRYDRPLHIATDASSLVWSVENGTLPKGLTLSADGVLQGVPTATGTYAFTVRATSGERSWFAPATINVTGDASIFPSVSQVVAALLGGPALSSLQVQVLDQIGNRNGILDAGDLRAYLRSQGRLP